jgi:hypothetical protein
MILQGTELSVLVMKMYTKLTTQTLLHLYYRLQLSQNISNSYLVRKMIHYHLHFLQQIGNNPIASQQVGHFVKKS